MIVNGSLWVYLLYDVADQIDLGSLREIIGLQAPGREPRFRHPAPDYVRFENAPVSEPLAAPERDDLRGARCRLKYYDYGVVSVELEVPFQVEFGDLVGMASRWMGSSELEAWAAEQVRTRVKRATAGLENPYDRFLSEDYYIMEIREARSDDTGLPLTATELLEMYGKEIAQIVRGETAALSPSEQAEVLASRLSYQPTDLLVAAWSGALVYDASAGVEPTLQILEYANSQLLEFRHYDEVLTRVLAGVYKGLDRSAGFWSRWRREREASRLNTIRLDVTDLAERADNSIKFLSDMFYARAYRMAAEKVGVTDYRRLVDAKLRTAGDLYAFLVGEFHQARAFVLELMVVIILIIDMVVLFAGKSK
jgi:hypothetical protein